MKTKAARGAKPVDPMERIAESLDLLVRLKVDEVKGERSQKEMIQFLDGFGVGSGEIAALLQLPRTTVDPELSKLRAAKKSGDTAKGAKRRRG
jgi:hypothetical protein